jgi:hypothetical protein
MTDWQTGTYDSSAGTPEHAPSSQLLQKFEYLGEVAFNLSQARSVTVCRHGFGQTWPRSVRLRERLLGRGLTV